VQRLKGFEFMTEWSGHAKPIGLVLQTQKLWKIGISHKCVISFLLSVGILSDDFDIPKQLDNITLESFY
jgi:hypothetical protein